MRFDDRSTSVFQYANDVMWRLDRDFDGRIALDDPFLPMQTEWFLCGADRNLDRFVDRFELQNEIAFKVDRNWDRQIDRDEARDANLRYGLPMVRFF